MCNSEYRARSKLTAIARFSRNEAKKTVMNSLSDRFADKLVGRIIDARSSLYKRSCIRPRCACIPTKTPTSSMTSTLERFRIALAMHRSCFSLSFANISYEGGILEPTDTYPAEKLSPPSETGESRFRKTLTLIVSGVSSGTSSDGIKCTRRRASNFDRNVHPLL